MSAIRQLTALLSMATLFPPATGCSRTVDAETRSEIESFIRKLARMASDMDFEGYYRHFSPDCPMVIHAMGKTTRTTAEAHRAELERALEEVEENDVEIHRMEVERGENGYRVRVFAREATVTAVQALEAETVTDFGIEKTPGGFRVTSYETKIDITGARDRPPGPF